MRRDESGVTLTEVAVVLVVLALLAAAIFPALGNVLQVMRSKGAAEEVASAVRLARQYAITRGNDHCIAFSGSPNSVFTIFQDAGCTTAVPGHTGQEIGHGFAVVSPANQSIVFNPVGNVVGGTGVTLSVDTSPSVCLSSVLVTLFGGVRVAHGC
jgi:prepilin-type N-terminal cleavage/methylation domain-containing protein